MITEFDDHYIVALAGARVLRCIVDHAFNIDLDHAGRYVTIRIEAPFQLQRKGSIVDLEPERKPEELGPALSLSRTILTSAIVGKDGGLELGFGDGSWVSVRSDEDLEAWTLTVTGGPMLVGGPGERVSIFQSSDRDA